MARYNLWQNNQLYSILKQMDDAELERDRGAFFGSIKGTLNHLLWGDLLWLSRLAGGDYPKIESASQFVDLYKTISIWSSERFRCDNRIIAWAESLKQIDLLGELTWKSITMDKEVKTPLSLCITHYFNHQTHHRGQVHAMLTAAGQKAPVSDLLFMPEDI
ncbi:DinB family protein [Sulfitobacter mediterraneus]|nr:DinB family protein [Sulfitobacter mediterraneus]MBM1557075.1 DinB family protein [Sulfitobacter mediterraneus]MBM1568121.1 DinB family protein [Sulfitobacter mediterraneus]MBM1572276.1 DinB family protein [Sulfitobacter mediterraneus]MBM1576065.1 DinB family protein [Sulfitobacter mediterraneus]MBM1580387.1 DinB family protein [Sulfitobacter mediterraneus]